MGDHTGSVVVGRPKRAAEDRLEEAIAQALLGEEILTETSQEEK